MALKLPPFEIGQKFGDWTVIAQLETAAENPKVGFSRVRCVCGTEKDMINNRLRDGKSNGCGCRRGRLLGKSSITHGKSYTANYKLWASIKHRLKSDTNYIDLGIKMYEPWVSDFSGFDAFIVSLGEKPTPMHSLDRIDPYGDYVPGNLRWADKTIQSQNRRNNIHRDLEKRSMVSVGKKYDMLTVLELVVKRSQNRNWYGARVRCDCGTIKTIKQFQLLSPHTKSCGCLRQSNITSGLGPAALEKPLSASGETHSMSAWARNTGISRHVIWSRVNKLGWEVELAATAPLTIAESITINGETKTVAEWCKINGIAHAVAHRRIHKNGWDPELAVTKKADRIVVGGKPLATLCRETGVPYSHAYNRIRLGWDPLLAATKPVTSKRSAPVS